MTTTNPYATAYQRFRDELAQATQWQNSDYKSEVVARERYNRVMQARAKLLGSVPPEVKVTAGVSRFDHLASRRPTTADEVAVAEQEWKISVQLLESGRSLEQIILSASQARLLALSTYIEVLPEALNSVDPDAVISEVRSLVFDRLVEAGDAEARKVADAEKRSSDSNAWREFLLGVLEDHSTVAQQTAVANADPAGWAAVNRDNQMTTDIDAEAEVRRLDRAFARKEG